MVRCFLFAVLLLACTSLHAQTEKKVSSPPHDEAKYYLTIFGDSNDVGYQQLVQNSRQPAMQEIVNETHFKAIPQGSTMFQDRYAHTVPDLPCVRLQTPDGRVVYQTSGANVPKTADALSTELRRVLPRWRQPAPQPQPEPLPQAIAQPAVVQPASVQADVPAPDPIRWGIILGVSGACAIGGGIAGVARQWVRTHSAA